MDDIRYVLFLDLNTELAVGMAEPWLCAGVPRLETVTFRQSDFPVVNDFEALRFESSEPTIERWNGDSNIAVQKIVATKVESGYLELVVHMLATAGDIDKETGREIDVAYQVPIAYSGRFYLERKNGATDD